MTNLPAPGVVRVVCATSPVSTETYRCEAAAGQSIAELLGGTDMPCEVTIGDQLVDRSLWRVVRPKAGSLVRVNVMPQDDALRAIAIIGVAIAAAAAGPAIAAAAPGLSGLLGAGVVSAAATTAITLAGPLVLDGLTPVGAET